MRAVTSSFSAKRTAGFYEKKEKIQTEISYALRQCSPEAGQWANEPSQWSLF